MLKRLLNHWFASTSHEAPQQKEPEMSMYFKSESGDLAPTIKAGISRGTVRPWRLDAQGCQWFVRDLPQNIRGIPSKTVQTKPPTVRAFAEHEQTKPSEPIGDDGNDVDDVFDQASFDEAFEKKREYLNRLQNFPYGADSQ